MLGKRLRKLRDEAGLTQKQLSKVLGITDRAVGYYETEKRTPPPDILEKLGDFFDVSVDYILGRTNVRFIIKEESDAINYYSRNSIESENHNYENCNKDTKYKENNVDNNINGSLIKDIEGLSNDSKRELEKYIKLLKLRDQIEKHGN
ncbi:putative HTH-type transcriptional regulator, XRE family [Gottschalkia acidurici 9a]|uniref:HTH-type transcriptional regulator, XRE family n=1 Tax=Gottschalkia acidurici (strain ATCC 7906 / DSM 604 / BCRC 14475 / CIP 104303 / KCTC 5404 / NCIMB 10678 / 9a) TaxID=1128398 RepID=K0AZ26_GOTA9|nr:helix-turn-helix transcriptional regulator [Gottschalkia acidurici]AFS78042.1 putative HTH-type transcriptional regulator, XRE family [Gottschalkia acidurici 9a]